MPPDAQNGRAGPSQGLHGGTKVPWVEVTDGKGKSKASLKAWGAVSPFSASARNASLSEAPKG